MSRPDSWRCKSCGFLMYNIQWIDGQAYPADGYPEPHYVSTKFSRVCTLCYQVHHIHNAKKGGKS